MNYGNHSSRPKHYGINIARILTLSVLVFFIASSSFAQYQLRKPGTAATPASIQVTSPTGGETWEKGQRYEITWTSAGIRGNVKIDLIDPQGKATSLTRMIANSGKHSFTLMRTVADGDYKIRISSTDGKTVGESAGTVHVGKTADSAAKTKPATTPGEIKPKTYTPRTVETPTTIKPKSTPTVTSTTQPVTVAEHTTVASPDVVHRDFTATQVPASNLQLVDLPTIIPTTTIQPRTPQMKLLPSMIDVTAPDSGVAWQAGEQYTIRWASNDLEGPVKIDLIKAQRGTDGVVSHFDIPVVASTENDGVYEYLVPERLGYHSTFYVCEVSSLDGQTKDQSPAYFDVYTEPIDMTCWVVDLRQRQDRDWYVFFEETEEWLEFDVWLRNNGTQRTVSVHTILVTIFKEPEELVVAEEEWGFSGINAQRWYSTPEPRKFNISSEAFAPFYHSEDIDLESGAYRVEIVVDPDNQLGENPALRDNNKHVRHFEIQ